MGLVGPRAPCTLTPLSGGVSSDIFRADVEGRSFCVKRALAKLKVAADWRAPVERNHSEAEWIRVASELVPDAVPRLIAEDAAAGLFAMQWLAPDAHPVWKAQLRDGTIEPAVAIEVGRRIARIHAATAGRREIAARFATDHIFLPIRLEPYLLATAERHPDVASALRAVAEGTARTKLALVHGDVSPKNILVGPRGPVFLDAECAWYGDPAFDLAFCLNHLLLKCLWQPQWRARYLAAFRALGDAYLAGVTWEPRDVFEARCARLLPGLFLARVDGKSPVEYVTVEADRDRVRACAKPLLRAPRTRLTEVAEAWRQTLARQ
ncbi:MAG TPA: aminoglycoside phosphotransferase family protein [Burkholderiales bacterium]|nr:aminoglycoside phosphotransferase family protein [Burkholderiales bacterium]